MKTGSFPSSFLLAVAVAIAVAAPVRAEEPQPALHVESAAGTEPVVAPPASRQADPTVEDGAICTTIDFEGISNLGAVPEFDGVTSPGWLGLIDADAGGSGNFAFEPSPETIAFWLGGAPGSRDILIADPASRLEFFYASAVTVQLAAFDADGNLVDSATGPPNFNQGPGGDPNGTFNKWDPLGVESDGNEIVRVQVTGNVNQTGIDDLKICRALRIHSLEITQAIQEIQEIEDLETDLGGDREPPVPLIEDKETVMRVYMQQVQTVVTVEVEVDIPGTLSQSRRLTLQPQCDPDLRRRRENGCLSLDFYFDAPGGDWDATVRLLTDSGDELETHDLPLRSREADDLVLRSVSVCDARDNAGAWQCGNAATLGGLLGLLDRTAPTDEVRVSASGNFVRNDIAGYDADGNGTIDNNEAINWFIDTVAQVGDLYGLWDRFLGFFGQERYYYGMLRNAVPSGTGGIADGIPSRGAMSRESTVRLGSEVNFETVAHEVGHALGRRHTNTNVPVAAGTPPGCYNTARDGGTDWPFADNTLQSANGPEVGFDVGARDVVLPESNFDWMGYCVPRWISPFTFTQAQPPLESFQGMVTELGQFWTVGGVLEEGGGVGFQPIFELEIVGSTDPGTGSHGIEARDASGVVLAQRRFTPRQAVLETADDVDVIGPPTFFELLPVAAGATAIFVVDPGGADLGSVALVGDPPAVTITFPSPADQLAGNEELTWTIVDPDSTGHWSAVDYSLDGGTTWFRLGLTQESSLAVDFDQVAGSTSALLRVTASDGVNSGLDVVGPFGVDRKLPSVEILEPGEDEVFASGDLALLRANAFDFDDGFLNGPAVEWFSNQDGPLGTGARLATTTLSEGVHQISVDATDSDGNLASDARTIRVAGAAPSLDLEVTALDQLPTTCVQVIVDAASGSTAVGLESVEYSLDGGASWTPVSLGDLPFSFIVPGQGFFHLVARAFDEAGQVDAADSRFFIDSPCAIQPPTADAGPDQVVECASPEGTTVTLDGSGSSDPGGNPLTYDWRDEDGNQVGTTAVVDVVLPLGTFTFTLTVDNGQGGTDSDSVDVTVQDTTPPALDGLAASPDLLWPPNHKMVPVALSATAVDACDPAPVVQIVGVTSSEPVTGPGDETAPDWMITGPLSVDLRAERLGQGEGRVYTIEVEAADASGNAATYTTEVLVPHDQGE